MLKWYDSRQNTRVENTETALKGWAKEKFDLLQKEVDEVKNLFYTYILPRPVKGNEGQ